MAEYIATDRSIGKQHTEVETGKFHVSKDQWLVQPAAKTEYRCRWGAIPPMPEMLRTALNEQLACDVGLIRNRYALETAAWAYTPMLNQNYLGTLQTLRHLVKIHVLIAPTDKDLLAALGTLVISATGLRSLKINAIGRLWPESNVPNDFYSNPTLVKDPGFYLVRSMDWLTTPLRQADKRLLLDELELFNLCICSSECSGLDSLVDSHRLKSLKLSCFRFIERRLSTFPSLERLDLGFRNGYVFDRAKCVTDWPAGTVRDFLVECRVVRHLSLVDRPDILTESVLLNIGLSLRSLDIHKTISLCAIQERLNVPYGIAVAEGYPDRPIEVVGKHCQTLQSLRISVPGPWPQVLPVLI